MPQVLVAEILGVFASNCLVVYFCSVDGTIEFAPQTVKESAALCESLLIGIKVMLQVARKTMLPS